MRTRLFFRRTFFRLRHSRGLAARLLLLMGILIIALSALVTSRAAPTAVELALAAATDEITLAVNETVAHVMGQEDISYQSLVTLEKDSAGNITALVSNVANINMLQARITNAIVERFADSDLTQVSIPLGNLIGGTLFSGRGPRIPLRILSITNVTASFRNEFTSAGINQTRHQIILDVEVTLEILLGGKAGTDSVLTEISVAETVIVGAVPDAYASMS